MTEAHTAAAHASWAGKALGSVCRACLLDQVGVGRGIPGQTDRSDEGDTRFARAWFAGLGLGARWGWARAWTWVAARLRGLCIGGLDRMVLWMVGVMGMEALIGGRRGVHGRMVGALGGSCSMRMSRFHREGVRGGAELDYGQI